MDPTNNMERIATALEEIATALEKLVALSNEGLKLDREKDERNKEHDSKILAELKADAVARERIANVVDPPPEFPEAGPN